MIHYALSVALTLLAAASATQREELAEKKYGAKWANVLEVALEQVAPPPNWKTITVNEAHASAAAPCTPKREVIEHGANRSFQYACGGDGRAFVLRVLFMDLSKPHYPELFMLGEEGGFDDFAGRHGIVFEHIAVARVKSGRFTGRRLRLQSQDHVMEVLQLVGKNMAFTMTLLAKHGDPQPDADAFFASLRLQKP